jgi:endonuclease YncB( thermonuclease family)
MFFYQRFEPLPPPPTPTPDLPRPASLPPSAVRGTVERVLSGDSLAATIDGRSFELRLAGIGVPDASGGNSGCDAAATVAQLRALASPDQTIYVAPDPSDYAGIERLTAYVWQFDSTTREVVLLNEALLEGGRASLDQFDVRVGSDLDARLTDAEQRARTARRGIWSDRCQDGTPLATPALGTAGL